MLIPQRDYRVIPAPSDGVFDVPGSWSVLRESPGFRTNLCVNPSAEESGSVGWFQGGTGTIYETTYPVRSTAQHYVGNASFSMDSSGTFQPQVGFYFTPPSLGHYVISVWMMKTGNLQSFEINFGASFTDQGIENQTVITRRSFSHFDGTDSDWFRFSQSVDITTLGPKFVRFRGNRFQVSESFVIYMDGIMVEKDAAPTDYFDGSFPGAVWRGVPNNSISSLDYELRDLSDDGFQMTALIGGNAPQWNTISTPYAFGGGYYQRSTPAMTEFSIVGTIESFSGRIELERKRRNLQNILSPRANVPIKLIYRPAACGIDDWARPLSVEAVYLSGLEGNLTNEFQESVALSFRIHTPYVASDIDTTQQAITILKDLDAWGGFIKRDPQGVYHQMNFIGTGGTLTAYVRGPDNLIYTAFSFGTNDTKVYKFDDINLVQTTLGAFTATSAGIAGDPCYIYHLRFDNNGYLWACGNFNAIGGNTFNNLARWDSAIWTSPISSIAEAYATGAATVQDVCFLSDAATAYVVGNFSSINGASRKNFAKLVGSTFSAVDAGINGADLDTTPPTLNLVIDSNDLIYIYGRFNGCGPTNFPANYWTYNPRLQEFRGIADVANSNAEAITGLLLLQDGSVLVTGTFTRIEGRAALGYAIFRASNWQRVPYLEAYQPPNKVSQNPNGWLEMAFLDAADLYSGGWLQFNGNVLIRPEYRPALDQYSGSPVFNTFFIVDAYPDGTIYLYGKPTAAGTTRIAHVPETNVIANLGDTDTWPEFLFIGPINVFNITNATTGKMMHFDLQLGSSDTAIMKLWPNVQIISQLRGDITPSMLAGSQPRDFSLAPGNNNINFGADAFGSTDTKIVMSWKNIYDSLGAVFI